MIAERSLIYRDEDGIDHAMAVQFARPERAADGSWRCVYRIGAPYGHEGTTHGEDSLQAIMMALVAAGAHLRRPALKGRVTWFGMTDLGFPEPASPTG